MSGPARVHRIGTPPAAQAVVDNEAMADSGFPIDTSGYVPLKLDVNARALSQEQFDQWLKNIDIMRDVIVFFTAISAGRGLAGHTSGAFDVVPEALLIDGFIRGGAPIYPYLLDEAGHRVALQYAFSAFNGHIPFSDLTDYRMAGKGLYGHPEVDVERGIGFASGRLGHIWPFANGIAMAHPHLSVVVLGSDGAQMEGNDAEAARLAVARKLNVKLLIDDNNVTIAGHPSEYLPGFSVEATLAGHGLAVTSGQAEEFRDLYARVQNALIQPGPFGVVNRRVMAPGVKGIEGETVGHDAIPVKHARAYLLERGHEAAAEYLAGVEKLTNEVVYRGSSTDVGSNRKKFGEVVSDIIDQLPEAERAKRVMVIDSDLAGSTGLSTIAARHPEVFVYGGVMERGNFSAAAGFGAGEGRQGVFSTFSAFLEMVVSELTMARLNNANVLCHFSHAGVDAIADNTSHFGINIMFADNGVKEQGVTPLYFPADALQFEQVLKDIFWQEGPRFIFSTRSEVPYIEREDGQRFFDPASGYEFRPGRDEVIREGTAGWVVSFGDMLHRSLDAVERLREGGIDVGLVNKPLINVPDEDMLEKIGKSGFVVVAESLNASTGLGSRMGTWLLERGLTPRYSQLGVNRVGDGGTFEQISHQGLDADAIARHLESLV